MAKPRKKFFFYTAFVSFLFISSPAWPTITNPFLPNKPLAFFKPNNDVALFLQNLKPYKTKHHMSEYWKQLTHSFMDRNTKPNADVKLLSSDNQQIQPFAFFTHDTSATQIIKHAEFGILSEPILEDFRLGIAAGAAAISNKATTQNQIALSPSLMGHATWHLCDHCVSGHPATVSLQVIADTKDAVQWQSIHNPIDQNWNLRENLVFSIGLF